MKSSSWSTKFGGLAVAMTIPRWMSTLHFRGAYYDHTVDPVYEDFQGPVIFLFWHEYIPFLFHLRGRNNITMLLSQHRDADLLAIAAKHRGFGVVRGSSTRGGAAAVRDLVELGQSTNIAITPDGPRGPRRKMAPGPIYLSSKLGIPLIAIGLGYDRPWRLSTWDRFAVPRPYSRARGIASPRIQIPPNVDRNEVEDYRVLTEKWLHVLTREAEAWAEADGVAPGSKTLFQQPRPYHYEVEATRIANGEILPLKEFRSAKERNAA